MRRTLFTIAILTASLGSQFAVAQAPEDSKDGTAVPASPLRIAASSTAADRFFEDEVWAKVGERTCLTCHNSEGDARKSGFVLEKPNDDPAWCKRTRDAFTSIATERAGEQSKLLLKITGGLDHGGGEVLKQDSSGYRILANFVRRVNKPSNTVQNRQTDAQALFEDDYESPAFFEAVSMISPPRLLRRVTISLCGRLPTPDELSRVEQDGLPAINTILDAALMEDAFYTRLKEAFNDIFLTVGVEDNAETILSYDHFEHTRNWTQNFPLEELPEAERERARWKLADVYRDALLREPLELIAHIVRNDLPFSELATADYIMVSPYTARGYGIFDAIKDEFKDPEKPFEYIPARLNALKGRDGKTQESVTGLYPHAGFLSMFNYLRRYPSTETNRNRLRARMFYQHFLGIDIMQLAPRSTDASAVAAKYEIPTMQAADCVVCHKTIDPVAGIFQDFNFEGHLGPRKDGWYRDMFVAGFEGEDMPESERWRAPQWLAERAVKDPRFPVAMVEHVYYLLFGRKVLQPPEDIDDPMFLPKRRSYRAQRQLIEACASQFSASSFNLRVAIKAMISSEFYSADGLETAIKHPERRSELDDVGIVRLIAPEQLERKIEAIFGKRWGRLREEYQILYGGIDSKTVTERNADPSGAMGAIQRIMANDVACQNVALDFRKKADERLLFPDIEPSVVPGSDRSDQQILATIVHLHHRLLGQDRAPTHPEVQRTFDLFAGILADAKGAGRYEPRESYFCGGREEFKTEDPHYTVRAWRGVVTYLLRQHEFLYE